MRDDAQLPLHTIDVEVFYDEGKVGKYLRLAQILLSLVAAKRVLDLSEEGFIADLLTKIRDEPSDFIVAQAAHAADSSGRLISRGAASGDHELSSAANSRSGVSTT